MEENEEIEEIEEMKEHQSNNLLIKTINL